ncbi:hypothetical protein ES703_90785 [subsurface metagenome]
MNVGDVVSGNINQTGVAECRGYENDSRQMDSHVLKACAEPSRPDTTMTSPGDEERRFPTPIPRKIDADELSHRVNIFFQPPKELFLTLLNDFTESSADRVDKDEICHAQKSILIVDDSIGGSGEVNSVSQRNHLRTETPYVQINRRDSRTPATDYGKGTS